LDKKVFVRNFCPQFKDEKIRKIYLH
jgi:hypothetical protein